MRPLHLPACKPAGVCFPPRSHLVFPTSDVDSRTCSGGRSLARGSVLASRATQIATAAANRLRQRRNRAGVPRSSPSGTRELPLACGTRTDDLRRIRRPTCARQNRRRPALRSHLPTERTLLTREQAPLAKCRKRVSASDGERASTRSQGRGYRAACRRSAAAPRDLRPSLRSRRGTECLAEPYEDR